MPAPQAPPSALELAAARQQAHSTIKTFATYAAGLYAGECTSWRAEGRTFCGSDDCKE